MRTVLRRSLSAWRRWSAPAPESFAQLWPLSPGGAVQLATYVYEGRCTAQEAALIASFASNGYVVFPRAVEDEVVDELVADVRSIARYPGRFVTTDHRRGRAQRLSDADFDTFESVFDTYVNFESARRVAFHPSIVRFLTLIFGTTPLAIQQLLFQRSNQHPIHQDTSVVCVEEPLLMAATWIALEDVVEGRGELTYYEGSHRIPHYLYADGSKRMNLDVDDAEAARRYLLGECQRLGCPKRDFIAKKGDVFVWAADLVHGSNPRTRPEHETRLSVVTHYCPRTTRPFWLRFHRKHAERVEHASGAAYMSSYYELPVLENIARPTFSP
jgi:ectoine hydroxylase-related dioxygenase (phytanoyl-CoA dioxygenase family)